MLLPEVHWVEAIRPLRLALMARPRGGEDLAGEIRGLAMLGVHTLVSLLEPAEARELELAREAEACSAAGLAFVHLPIADRAVPRSAVWLASATASLIATLRDGNAIALHCRAGIGRTGLVAACLLIDLGHSPQGVFDTLSRARGVSMPDTDEQAAWVNNYARGRRTHG